MQRELIKLTNPPAITAAASVVGSKEREGPLGNCFDLHDPKNKFGKDTWERSESEMQRIALNLALAKCKLSPDDIDALFAGDLLNQCVGSSYGLIDFDIPYFGLYGACSTAAEGIILGSMLLSGDIYRRCAAVASSHNCSAERQYRFPLEYGGQRTPTAQWTVTGSGAFVLSRVEQGPKVTEVMPGIVIEKGVKDANNMGAAMAPAAIDTLKRYFEQSGTEPKYFDLILTGDLGTEGGAVVCDLLGDMGYDVSENYTDCGTLIYNHGSQDTHAGGSGCGCSAVVFASHILPKLCSGELNNVLLIGTGAMMSPASIQQGEAIPAIAHLARIQNI